MPRKEKRETGPVLYVPAVFVSFRRGKRNIHPSQALLKIDGVLSSDDAKFYVGKHVEAPIRIKPKKKSKAATPAAALPEPEGDKPQVPTSNPGVVLAVHGNSGVVRAKFERNLPPEFLGTKVRVFLYPSTI